MFRRFLPREVCFFDYFEKHASLAVQACEALVKMTHGEAGVTQQAGVIKDIEHEADKVTHECIEVLNKTFITPIDRADVHQLIKRLDDIVDAVDATTSRIALYELAEMRTEARELADVLLKAAREMDTALKCLRNLKNVDVINAKLIAVHGLESEGDAILRTALTRLFTETEPILVIKWKEIFERLENATDRYEQVANIVEKIVLEAS